MQLVLEELTGGQLWDRVLQGSYSERQAARIVRDVMRTIAQVRAGACRGGRARPGFAAAASSWHTHALTHVSLCVLMFHSAAARSAHPTPHTAVPL